MFSRRVVEEREASPEGIGIFPLKWDKWMVSGKNNNCPLKSPLILSHCIPLPPLPTHLSCSFLKYCLLLFSALLTKSRFPIRIKSQMPLCGREDLYPDLSPFTPRLPPFPAPGQSGFSASPTVLLLCRLPWVLLSLLKFYLSTTSPPSPALMSSHFLNF